MTPDNDTPPTTAGTPPGAASDGEDGAFSVTLTLEHGYRFAVEPGLPGAEGFHIDETPPLGEGSAANPSRILVSAMASCLASSLAFCLGKSRIELKGMRAVARGTLVRNERKRLRVGSVHIELFPEVA
ncbi:MAG TPA: OsmC family protein, partial [Gemmatimonadaceae bacterium]|nr:OsmC family protein [Gemmatimonadaceae bacterium]